MQGAFRARRRAFAGGLRRCGKRRSRKKAACTDGAWEALKLSELDRILAEAGVFQYGFVDTADIRFSQEVRGMCAVNTCRQYGKTWACPPAIGTVEECRARVQRYDRMLVFSVKYNLEDSFDYEGMVAGMQQFRETCRILHEGLRGQVEDFLLLANEGCDKCEKCTYPDAPCRFPDQTHGALEGYGIFVSELAKQAGIHYINGANTVTYFGGVACDAGALDRLQNA